MKPADARNDPFAQEDRKSLSCMVMLVAREPAHQGNDSGSWHLAEKAVRPHRQLDAKAA